MHSQSSLYTLFLTRPTTH
uniref:Uncharacterized protein n=1 Tax=Rhizophora mucronata TaxID=61149 RepID=A0A2P2M1D4_RHIMU